MDSNRGERLCADTSCGASTCAAMRLSLELESLVTEPVRPADKRERQRCVRAERVAPRGRRLERRGIGEEPWPDRALADVGELCPARPRTVQSARGVEPHDRLDRQRRPVRPRVPAPARAREVLAERPDGRQPGRVGESSSWSVGPPRNAGAPWRGWVDFLIVGAEDDGSLIPCAPVSARSAERSTATARRTRQSTRRWSLPAACSSHRTMALSSPFQ